MMQTRPKTLSITLKKCAASLLTLAAMLSTSGCGGLIYANYRDLSALQLIQTMGIDRDGKVFTITVSTGEGVSEEPPVIISRPGESIVSAMDSVQNYSSSESVYFSHTEFVVFGEEAAKNSLEEFIDYIARGYSIRLDSNIFVIRGDTAKNLIIKAGEKGIDVTQNLSAISRDARRQGTAFTFTGREIASSITEYGSALICAVSAPQDRGEETVDESEKGIFSSGYAIIRQGKLCGFLDEELVWATNILLNKSGFATMDLKPEENLTVSLHSVSGSAEYSAEWGVDGSLDRIIVEVEVEGHLIETSSSSPDSQEDEFLGGVTAALENEIKNRCLDVLNRSRNLEADFVGLLGVLRQKYPGKIAGLGGSFIDALSGAEIEVSVKGTVLRSFDAEGIPQILDGGISE